MDLDPGGPKTCGSCPDPDPDPDPADPDPVPDPDPHHICLSLGLGRGSPLTGVNLTGMIQAFMR